ncbi:conserved hypothetical protein [Ricinus communis]|uniref:Uncharacterized protein n=1 Tax=Ricinus communis TaxID=3988 RepID=B9S550_RICCO|nr:conserved hypothetical protein [Ricinus communis]
MAPCYQGCSGRITSHVSPPHRCRCRALRAWPPAQVVSAPHNSGLNFRDETRIKDNMSHTGSSFPMSNFVTTYCRGMLPIYHMQIAIPLFPQNLHQIISK